LTDVFSKLESVKDEFADLTERLRAHFSARDLGAIFFPPWLGYEVMNGLLDKRSLDRGDFSPDLPDKDALAVVIEFWAFLGKYYFRTNVEGVENVPESGPGIIVCNHSAGLMPMDGAMALDKLHQRYGRQRIVHPLVHDFAYIAETIGAQARRIGILRASVENSRKVLDAGRLLMVYPGGDMEAFRPFKERNKIVLAGRKGFVRIALQERVPIIPLVSVGLHESFFVMTRGKFLAKKLGFKKYLRSDLFPLGLSFPWGLAPSFMMFMPMPSAIDMRFGEPIEVDGDPEDPEVVEKGYRRVEAAMQSIMDELSKDRVLWLGRPSRRK
jgi:1-acyl-sn-glycerol-3-phosphate acyltransferase